MHTVCGSRSPFCGPACGHRDLGPLELWPQAPGRNNIMLDEAATVWLDGSREISGIPRHDPRHVLTMGKSERSPFTKAPA